MFEEWNKAMAMELESQGGPTICRDLVHMHREEFLGRGKDLLPMPTLWNIVKECMLKFLVRNTCHCNTSERSWTMFSTSDLAYCDFLATNIWWYENAKKAQIWIAFTECNDHMPGQHVFVYTKHCWYACELESVQPKLQMRPFLLSHGVARANIAWRHCSHEKTLRGVLSGHRNEVELEQSHFEVSQCVWHVLYMSMASC